jgi:hypothetical protein
MIKIKVPSYIVLWVLFFLQNRTFEIRVNEAISRTSSIVAGVPQGSSISPILFSIFINDIPAKYVQNVEHSLLFADDLMALFMFNKTGQVKVKARKYLEEIEKWLALWRLKMAPSKCNYTIFSKTNQNLNKIQGELSLKMFGEPIPYEANPVSLGIKFDEKLNFQAQVKSIKEKCVQRLNIIKILSHRSWQLSKSTLVSIYRSLIGSVLDYSSFMVQRLSEGMIKSLQAIQNNAVRIIFREPFEAHTVDLCDLCEKSGLDLVKDRMVELNARYFTKALAGGNDLIVDLFRSFKDSFSSRTGTPPTLLCESMNLYEPYV